MEPTETRDQGVKVFCVAFPDGKVEARFVTESVLAASGIQS